jgi:hypothetical protein
VLVSQALSLLLVLTTGAFDPNSAVYPNLLRCDDALEFERALEAEVSYEGPYDPLKPNVISKRRYLQDQAAVIYICEASIAVSRLVTMRFDSEQSMRAAFERHRISLAKELGPPCWDPEVLSVAQKAELPSGDLTELGWFRDRLEWNAHYNRNTSLTMNVKVLQLTLAVSSLSHTIRGSDDGPIGKAYALSSCSKGQAK